MSTAYVFPGQGSQVVGMGQALAEAFAPAREIFDRIDDALDQPLSRLMFDGPQDQLTLTENAQPALMAVSLATVAVLRAEAGLEIGRAARFVAGHSLGEYSALAAAGALDLADAARLLRTRGRAMQQAVPVGAGAMAAILGLELAAVEALAGEAAGDGVCTVANDNAPGQVVLSGDTAAIARAIELARARGAKRSVLLPVSAPFHCALMAPAARVMQDALQAVALAAPLPPLVANVTASPVTDPAAIKALLVTQVTGRVRWRESVAAMAAAGVTRFVEIGTGKVLTGLNKRIADGIDSVTVGTPDEVRALAATAVATPEPHRPRRRVDA